MTNIISHPQHFWLKCFYKKKTFPKRAQSTTTFKIENTTHG